MLNLRDSGLGSVNTKALEDRAELDVKPEISSRRKKNPKKIGCLVKGSLPHL